MKFLNCLIFFFTTLVISCADKANTDNKMSESKVSVLNKDDDTINIIPVEHATFILEANETVIYIDPTGGLEVFKDKKTPNLILITDIHGDHLNIDTLETLNLKYTTIIAPKAVVDKLPKNLAETVITLNNGESHTFKTIKIEAVPMYNLREEALQYHSKGRGNGYVVTINNERIYISGDTEDIPEMRNLRDIDRAFVCMNLPYTMPVSKAASAVLDFKPRIVYPYHYRGTHGLSDINKFKNLVNAGNNEIKVIELDWY